MNEHIDILMTSAKLVTRENPWASIVTHAISSGYNTSMIGKYRYELGLVKAGAVSYSADQIQSLQRDLTKHCILGLVDVFGLILSSFSERWDLGQGWSGNMSR